MMVNSSGVSATYWAMLSRSSVAKNSSEAMKHKGLMLLVVCGTSFWL